MKKFLKDKKGITLVALVITIIILLILASISIVSIMEENGIIIRTQYAKFVSEYETVNEATKLYILNQNIDKTLNKNHSLELYPITGSRITNINNTLKETIKQVNNKEVEVESLNLYQIDFSKIDTNINEIYVIDIDTQTIYLLNGIKIGKTIYHIPKIKVKSNNNIEEPTICTVTLNSNGGICEVANIQKEVNQIYGTLPKPTKEGYDFLGWYTEESAGELIQETDIVTSNITLYARWEKKVNLIAWYDGINNTNNGHDYETTTWTDLTGNNTTGATINGAVWTKNGLYFNGDSDWVNMNSILMPKQDDFAIELVMEVETYQSEGGFFIGQNSSNIAAGRLGLRIDSNHKIGATYGVSTLGTSEGGKTIGINSEYELKEKEKITIVFMKKDILQIWINGEKVAEDVENGRQIYQGNTILGNFGMVTVTPRYFKGLIYSVKAYDGPITQEKMKNNTIENMERYANDTLENEQYNNYVKDNLKAWYDGINNTNNGHYYSTTDWIDLTGNNTTAAKLSGARWKHNGLYFDGSNDYLNMNNILIPSEANFTLEIVTEMKKYPTELCFIMGQNNSNSTASNRFGLMYSKSTGQLRINRGTTGFDINYKPELNEKITITLRRNDSIMEVFINGTNIGNFDVSGLKIYQANTILGRWGLYDSRYSNAIIYSLRMYDKDITDEEIEQNYNVDKLRFEM